MDPADPDHFSGIYVFKSNDTAVIIAPEEIIPF
jgi:hypothetical protein